MEDKKVYTLQIDQQFKNLIRPLKRKEYLQLEANILEDGCRDPLIIWNGYIVDGHNRYEICTRHQIPFGIISKEFECREAVIAWICANQLGRRNITEETRKFLIGKQYESEKIVASIKNVFGVNQYTKQDDTLIPAESEDEEVLKEYRHKTAARIAKENNVSRGTVEKYAIYSRAIETIGKKAPAIIPNILSGKYKISHSNIVELSKLTPGEIKKVARRIERTRMPYVQYKTTRQEIQASDDGEQDNAIEVTPSIKDMPQYDPDAEIVGLSLTVPSWTSSIERVMKNLDISAVSCDARIKLAKTMIDLQFEVQSMLSALKED